MKGVDGHIQDGTRSGRALSEETVVCPECGCEFPLSTALTANIEKRVRFEQEQVASHREEELAIQHQEELAAARQSAVEKAQADVGLEMADLRAELDEKSERL